MEDRTCAWCGKKLVDGQRVFKPEVKGSEKPPVCCSVQCAMREAGIPEKIIRQVNGGKDSPSVAGDG
jgi:hypothetical protein